jgi:hypothetical protein
MTKRVWGRFAALCLLGGSAWIFDEYYPAMLTGLLHLATHNLALAAVFGLVGWYRKDGARRVCWWKVSAASIAMIALPEIVSESASGHVSHLTEVLIYMLVPVVIVVAAAQKAAGFGNSDNPLRLVAPALVSLGGAALVIPSTWPQTVTGRLFVVAMGVSALLAGLAAVWLHDLLAGTNAWRAAAVVAASSGAVGAACCWIGWQGIADGNAAGVAVEALR